MPGATHWLRREGPPHLQTSRNQGIGIATGDIVLLLDDDCLMSPGWVEGHARIHAAAPGHLVVGDVRRVHYDGRNEFWMLPPARHGWGVDDVDLTYRLMKSGVPLMFEPSLLVFHQEYPCSREHQGEQEAQNLRIFAERHGFWPYGAVPTGYRGAREYPKEGAWFHVCRVPSAASDKGLRVTWIPEPGPHAPREPSRLNFVFGRRASADRT
jgi:hypothetical protein